MNIDKLTAAVSQAQESHEKFPQISLDAHFIAAFLGHRTTKPHDEQVAEIHVELVADLDKIRGTSGTATEIFKQINWREPTAREARACGTALRTLGYTPRKSNGRLIFDI